jgi:hypothetical protein
MKSKFCIRYFSSIAFSIVLMCSVQKSYGQASLFPQISGWECTEDSVVYNPNNLWDIIDGAADLFLEYNFVSLHIARYVKSDTLDIKVELYEHRSAEDAFGMYSQERDTSYHFIKLGVQGYREQGILNFCAGNYYVKISSIQSGREVQNALLMIGFAVEKNLLQPALYPETLRLLPLSGRVQNTEQYIARNFLGYGFFGNAYVATYNDKGATFRTFIMKFENSKGAAEALNEYLRVMPKGSVKAFSDGRHTARDPHYGTIEFILNGDYLAGIVNTGSESVRKEYFEELQAALSRVRK